MKTKVWIVCIVALLAWGAVTLAAEKIPAPSWELQGPDGLSWNSEALRGNVVVLEFWATWCAECETNMLAVADLARDYADRSVKVIAVNFNETGDPVAYMQEQGSEIDFALNGESVAELLGVKGTPIAVVIDSEGHIVGREVGAGPARTQRLRNTIDGLLK